MKEKHMMIDLETLDTSPSAVVSAIGAVIFDIENGKIEEKFYKVLSIDSQLKKGRTINESTLSWWFSQSKEASSIYTTENKEDTDIALYDLIGFMFEHSDINNLKVWGNGPSFDLSILESLMRTYNYQPPYSFRNIRCLRTFKEFVAKDIEVPKVGIHHNALDDCLYQINLVKAGLGLDSTNNSWYDRLSH